MNTHKKKLSITPYFYLIPCMLVFAVFLFYPFFKTIFLSLFLTDKMGQAKIFVGLQNYMDLLASESFRKQSESYADLCGDRCSRRHCCWV